MSRKQDIEEYFESQFTFYKLLDYEVEYDSYKVNGGKRTSLTFKGNKFPIHKLSLKTYEHERYCLLFINIGNFIFNGREIRSKLLKAGIRNYTKDSRTRMGQTSHSYRITFSNKDELVTILDCFKKYLP